MNLEFRDIYDSQYPTFRRLANNITESLAIFLNENKISFLKIDSRIKDYESCIEKIERKAYNDSFEQIEDICGVRIICYYLSDVNKINDLIKREFDIVESQDKLSKLGSNEFNYRSHHFIVKIPSDWLIAPNYRGLENLKAEIQVRTILMHAWAEIEHKLAYKKDYQIEDTIKREFSKLSAILESADDQFERLREQSEKYKEDLIFKQKNNQDSFKNHKSLDIDSLQAFVEYHFPERIKDKSITSNLLDELLNNNISFKDLNEIFNGAKDFAINVMEKEDNTTLNQAGVVNWSLMLINERYWNYFQKKYESIPGWIQKFGNWRDRFKNNNA